jgi:2-polyprenyl-6-methoxyphenol hydroxylase-like FAD-dependent oxidoreductase
VTDLGVSAFDLGRVWTPKHSPAAVFARLSHPNPPTVTPIVLDTAVVLGGSIAGLLAARVFSDHAGTVIVIDKDDPGTSTELRPGVPQGTQMHSLLPSGLAQLERWFPGFTEQALAAGAHAAPPSARRFYFEGIRRAGGSQAMMLTGSRPFMEAQIRLHTLSLPNVKTITARVTGLEFGAGAVTGVQYESGGEEGVERADFVMDAMGRSSRLSEWLAQAGWERPAVRRISVDLNYATALLRREDGDPEIKAVLALRSPAGSVGVAGAALSQIEGARWMIGMAGYADSRPGRTVEDLVGRCKTEFPPEFGQVAGNEILGEVRSFRHADSLRRDFHALTRMPARLAAMGDAVASTNPLHAQGVASTTLQASCLSEYLRSDPDLSRPAREFFALQKVVVDAAWGLATGVDLALPHVDGPGPRGYRLLRWIYNQVRAASFLDPEIGRRFEEVTWMLKHPSSLAAPGTLTRAIRANRRARTRARPAR